MAAWIVGAVLCAAALAQERPAGEVRVWNSDVLAPQEDILGYDAQKPLGPIRIVGARGGTFSGKVVVGCPGTLKGVSARAAELTQTGGTGRIGTDRIQVRYALVGLWESWQKISKAISRFDVLAERPPEEVRPHVSRRKSPREAWIPPGRAILPVWVTVSVPPDVPAGDYTGTVTLTLPGGTTRVPVRLTVCDYTLPDPKHWRTWSELIQSPDTLSLVYHVPLWSEKHWRLIDRSMAYVAAMGTRSCYIPLIAETNLGNAESMVRWRRKGPGKYTYDFSVMERYLDVTEKHLGRPGIVVFQVWDNFLEGGRFSGDIKFETKQTKAERLAYRGKGPEVTRVDAGGRVSGELLPPYSDAKAHALWKPLTEALLRRLARRGLKEAAALGMVTDSEPTKAVVDLWRSLLPGVGWVRHAHGSRKELHGVPYRYQLQVWHLRFANPNRTAQYHGWHRADLVGHLARDLRANFPMLTFRYLGEMNIGGAARGFGRFGADFWPVREDARVGIHGGWGALVSDGRFPKSSWRNLNVRLSFLAPGPDGALATARYEMLREGVQECEARIVIDEALLEGRITGALAERCRKLLNARDTAMIRGFNITNPDDYFANFVWYCSPGKAGEDGILWHARSDWQKRSGDLFTAAGQVAATRRRPH